MCAAERAEDRRGGSGSDEKTGRAVEKPLPLHERPLDLVFVFWFIAFAFSTLTTDYHNFMASHKGVKVHQLDQFNLPWPPKIVTSAYLAWGRTVDPLLLDNPVWFQAMEWVNLVYLTPMSFVLIYAFVTGKAWVQKHAIVHSAFMFYSLCLCLAAALVGDLEDRSPHPDIYKGIYIPYLLFPLAVLWRVWGDDPFCESTVHAQKSGFRKIIDMIVINGMLITLGMFFYTVYVWFCRFGDTVFHEHPGI